MDRAPQEVSTALAPEDADAALEALHDLPQLRRDIAHLRQSQQLLLAALAAVSTDDEVRRARALAAEAIRVNTDMLGGIAPASAATLTEGSLPEGIAGLDTTKGLALVRGNTGLYLSMLARFMEDQRGSADDVAMSLALGDAAAAQRIAHTVKGASASLGATDMQAAAASLEQALKDGVRGLELQMRVRAFDGTLSALIEALAQRL